MYSYTNAGLATKKRLDVYRGVNTATLDSNYSYDNEGKMTGLQYPAGGSPKALGYDAMGRLQYFGEANLSVYYASNAQYNASAQLTSFVYGPSQAWTETRTYNTLGQMTRMTIPTIIDSEYTFHATQNNGRITKYKDHITGEEVKGGGGDVVQYQTFTASVPRIGLFLAPLKIWEPNNRGPNGQMFGVLGIKMEREVV